MHRSRYGLRIPRRRVEVVDVTITPTWRGPLREWLRRAAVSGASYLPTLSNTPLAPE
jgi:hypothetical protein